MEKHKAEDIIDFFELLNAYNIDYVLIKNICDELPENLRIDKDIDILIKSENWNLYNKICKQNGIMEIEHPYGICSNFSTLYGVDYPHMFLTSKSLMIDVSKELCIKCLDMPAWIPLDKEINTSIWEHRYWNNVLHCRQMDEKNLICYLIARSIFDKSCFSDDYRLEIEKRLDMLDDQEVQQKLMLVFFQYTPVLIRELKNGNYDQIKEKYIRFDLY